MRPSALYDYVTSPRIRDEWNDDFDNVNCQRGGKHKKNLNKNIKKNLKKKIKHNKHFGGSVTSDYVMSQLNTDAKTIPFQPHLGVKADINSLNTYKPSGGARLVSNKTHKKHKNGKFNKNKKSLKNMKGGYGSDWMSSQYSLGSYNASPQSADYVKQFSNSGAGNYITPPNLESAGSGGAISNLEGSSGRVIGAPLV